ncbi:hypothetical protein [Polaribacter sp.]|uniref:hypothetical protein n=1 Tax=Polaribacter sp. TaxID=1920175 RepID=UPI003F6D7B63
MKLHLNKIFNTKQKNMTSKQIDQLLKDYENDISIDWHKAMGDRKINFRETLTYSGMCAERICRAVYLRTYKKDADEKTGAYEITNHFYKEGIIDDLMKLHLVTVRKPRNISVHLSKKYNKVFVDIIRDHLMQIMIWYKSLSGTKLYGFNINKYQKMLSRNPVARTLSRLRNDGAMSQKNFEKSIASDRIMTIQPEEKMVVDIPVFSSLIIDESGSMSKERNQVIEAHKEALIAIRGSMICKKESLFLVQHTFNYTSTMLNSLSVVDTNQNDKIIALDKCNYIPNGTTTLYDTLYEVVTMLHIEADSFKATGRKAPQIVIGVLTDGEDTGSGYSAEDVKKLMKDLYDKRVIKSSVVIGWADGKNLMEGQLESLRKSIGFEKYICLEKANPSAIREAFKLWSQFTVG